MTTAATWKLCIDQGTTCTLAVQVLDAGSQPVNPAGYSAHLQVRDYATAPDPPLLDLSTGTGEITVDTVNMRLVITIPASATAALAWRHGVYDLLVTAPDGTAARWLKGEVDVTSGVTVGAT